ncbi:hypothetical protein KVR01_002239 [Diaporthe batatas]|uniref:uncharacterized protein n=1 Tax=Diaporthe batatas TaxID=748121 RepID=UPI001D03B4C1|nr:uncharacterized protein KVR01_002239 [Diaporthe batatas]KAG8166550.1 hypothetical protein KVR01_002239 [Diaporthe batatas]
MGRARKAGAERKKSTGLKPFKCTYKDCNKAYPLSSVLKNHVDAVHLGITFTCPEPGCGKVYTYKVSRDNHVKTAHRGKKFPCLYDDCDKSFSCNSGLYQHTQTKHVGKIWECVFSDYERKFTTSSGLYTHVQHFHKGIRHRCKYDDCPQVYAGTSGLSSHVNSVHIGNRWPCLYDDCEKVYTALSSRERHDRVIHQGIKFPCNVDKCNKTFSYWQAWDDHRHSEHLDLLWDCPWDQCERQFCSIGGLRYHTDSEHEGIRFTCPACGRIFSVEHNWSAHVKSVHGTAEDAAELSEKKDRIRQALAEKEAQGLCSATKKCKNAKAGSGFHCQFHEKTVDSVAKALEEKAEEGRLQPSSIQKPDEFALLLQREKVYLDPEAVEALQMLAQGLDDVQTAARSYVMDTEFCWAGEYVAMDITIERLKDGKEIVSSRIDLEMGIEELEDRCAIGRSRTGIRKVYGKSDRT